MGNCFKFPHCLKDVKIEAKGISFIRSFLAVFCYVGFCFCFALFFVLPCFCFALFLFCLVFVLPCVCFALCLFCLVFVLP